MKTIARTKTIIRTDVGGTRLHSIDGPAVEYSNGSKEWYFEGVPHREDGPAQDYFGGYKAWFVMGVRHRTDGPAITHPIEFYINGKHLTLLEFIEHDLVSDETVQEVLTKWV